MNTGSYLARILLAFSVLLAGCTSVPNSHPDDPLESLNRSVFRFNEGVDTAVMKPTAKAYVAVVPSPVRQGVRNVLGNVDDSWSFVNAMLQGKRDAAGQNLGRVLVNSSLGMAGLFDIATEAGIERQEEDFGQTLAVWGVPKGPYLMVPIFGPSTVRDGLGQGVWLMASPWQRISDEAQYSALGLKILDARVQLLDADHIMDDATTDRYSFVRSAYWQRREYQIRDGQPLPREDDADEAPAQDGASTPVSPKSETPPVTPSPSSPSSVP